MNILIFMAKKILIIEDEEYIAEIYKLKLEKGAYEVLVASDGQSGLDLARTARPDLILLDIVLPKLDGYDFLQALRQDPEIKNTLVYVISNLGQNAEIKKGLESGADGYFVKANLTPQQLLENINKILIK